MQQQVSIISETISNLNSSFSRMNHNVNILNNNLKNFNRFSHEVNDLTKKVDIELDLANHLFLLIEMSEELYATLSAYVNDLSFIHNGILNFHMLPPETLYFELQRVSIHYALPLPLTIDNIYVYYKLLHLTSFLTDDFLVIAFKIPISSMHRYDLYNIFPLPTPHVNDSSLFSYIEPTKPYILVSSTRTFYSLINSLDTCTEYQPAQWLCTNIPLNMNSAYHTCEFELFLKTTMQLPSTCKVRHLIADAQIWHPLQANQWLFALSDETQLTVVCHDNPSSAVILHRLGILQLRPTCKAYTAIITLEADSSLDSSNFTNEIPLTDIVHDDCCIRLRKNLSLSNVHLDPLQLNNLNLNELRYAQHKLSQFDEQLQQELKKPYIIQHTSWISVLLSATAGFLFLTIAYKFLKWFGIFKCLRSFFCFSRAPRDSSNCLLQIFNQCHNQPATPPVSVNYNADLHHISYQPPTHQDSSLPEDTASLQSLRRSKRLKTQSQFGPR